jgi:hypothetical protein
MKGIPEKYHNSLLEIENSLIWHIERSIIEGRIEREYDDENDNQTPKKIFLNERIHKHLGSKSKLIQKEAISYSLSNAGLFFALLSFRKDSKIKDADNLEAMKALMNSKANPKHNEIYKYCDYMEVGQLNTMNLLFTHEYTSYLAAITNTESCRNPLAKITKSVVNNYAVNVIKLINEAIICNDLNFLLFEIYNMTVKYDADDFDAHLSDDIPEIPYSRNRNDLLGAYICLPKNDHEDEIIEYLFVTENRYHHVKLTNYYTSKKDGTSEITYHHNPNVKTKSYRHGQSIRIFGSETLLTPDGLTLLEMEHYDLTNLTFISDFAVDETKLKHEISYQRIGYTDNRRLSKMLMDYYTLHKGAWITEINQIGNYRRRTTFTPSPDNLATTSIVKECKTPDLSLVRKYWHWKNGGQQIGSIPNSLHTIIMRKAVKEVERVESDLRFERNFFLGFKITAAVIGTLLLYFL